MKKAKRAIKLAIKLTDKLIEDGIYPKIAKPLNKEFKTILESLNEELCE